MQTEINRSNRLVVHMVYFIILWSLSFKHLLILLINEDAGLGGSVECAVRLETSFIFSEKITESVLECRLLQIYLVL